MGLKGEDHEGVVLSSSFPLVLSLRQIKLSHDLSFSPHCHNNIWMICLISLFSNFISPCPPQIHTPRSDLSVYLFIILQWLFFTSNVTTEILSLTWESVLTNIFPREKICSTLDKKIVFENLFQNIPCKSVMNNN